MTKESAQMALLLFDALLTATDRIAEKIQEAKEQGLITIEEQQARELDIESVRAKVGLPSAGVEMPVTFSDATVSTPDPTPTTHES